MKRQLVWAQLIMFHCTVWAFPGTGAEAFQVLLKPPLSWISSETPSGLFQCCGLVLVGFQQEQWRRVNLLGMQELHTHHSIFIKQGFRSHISISSSARACPQMYSMFAFMLGCLNNGVNLLFIAFMWRMLYPATLYSESNTLTLLDFDDLEKHSWFC